MNALRSALFALLFYPGTLLVCLTGLLVAPFGRRPIRSVVHFWARFHHWLVHHVLRIRFEWNREVPDGAYIVAVKHHAMVEAVDTRSNAAEAKAWLAENDFDAVRLVTSDWHMRRATFEFREELGEDFPIIFDAVPTSPGLMTLFGEYNKYVLRRIGLLLGI